MNLTSWIATPLLPLDAREFSLVIAIFDPMRNKRMTLEIVGPTGTVVVGMAVGGMEARILELTSNGILEYDAPSDQAGLARWFIQVVDLRTAFGTAVFFEQAGKHQVFISQESKRQLIGEIMLVPIAVPELTDERRAAIRSDPYAAKTVIVEISCKLCSSRMRAYTALTRTESVVENATWYEDLPDRFNCSCGGTDFDLLLMRRNLHVMLGGSQMAPNQAIMQWMYEESSLAAIVAAFDNLLATKSGSEESIHRFIRDNPLLLNMFSPVQIFHKKRILTDYVSDICILTSNKELLLIELEKPSTKLLTRRGRHGAGLTEAFGQVNDWLDVTKNHRLSVLESFRLKPEQVAKIVGVVIAGRDGKHETDNLKKLKGTDHGEKRFYTYDDMLGAMRSLAAEFTRFRPVISGGGEVSEQSERDD